MAGLMLAALTDRQWMWAAGACYLAGFLAGNWSLRRGWRPSGVAMYGLIAAGYILQVFGMAARGRAVAGCPLGNAFELCQFTAWSAITLYLIVGVAFRSSLLGFLTCGLGATLTLASLALPALDVTRRVHIFGGNAWIEFHAALALFSYGVFALLALTSLLLLFRLHSLHSKHLGGWFSLLPAVVDLDQIGVRLLMTAVGLLRVAGGGFGLLAARYLDGDGAQAAADRDAMGRGGGRLADAAARTPAGRQVCLDLCRLVRRRADFAGGGQCEPPADAALPHGLALMNAAGFFVIGATHHAAPISVREKLALAPGAELDLHRRLAACGAVSELAILSTCNRVEFYGVAADAPAAAVVERHFCDQVGFEAAEFAAVRLRLDGIAAARHLFEVAAGIDSQMVGENEIFGQVKEAYAAAAARGTAGPVLNRIFQKAFQAAKHVRTHTAVAAGHVSVANVAVDLAQNVFGDLRALRVLLIGAGDIGEKTARAFQSRGVTRLTLCSRRLDKTLTLAESLGAGTLPFEQRESRLLDFDVAVCATAAPGAVITAAAVAAAVRRRSGRPLLLLDLALPRDVESSAAAVPNVFLYNLDDLAEIADENRSARAGEVARCRQILAERSELLWRDLTARGSMSAETASRRFSNGKSGGKPLPPAGATS
jgi:glutamyl-tRNA reductase